jgi:polyisoprenoid-binding protein YceI
MKRVFVPILLLLLITCAFAQVKSTVSKSSIKFQIKNLGIKTGGNIGGLQANIQFDAANPATSTIEASVDVNTINTDNDTRDNHLRSDEFFDVPHFPKITMKSVSIKHKSGDKYVGLFNVTIKDKTKPLEMPFTYNQTSNTALIKGELKLNRLDFGVGDKSFVLSNDVTVTIELETTK